MAYRQSIPLVAILAACSADTHSAGLADGGGDGPAKSPLDAAPAAADANDGAANDAALAPPDGAARTPFEADRDRLLGSYLDYLKSTPATTQSNGLSGGSLGSVCDLWSRLDPSSQAVFLTLTARLEGSRLGDDGSFMLDHVVKLYRVSGGQGATATSAGSCGGGEYNRMILSTDLHLHASLVAANTHQGAKQANGAYDIADIPAASYWRDSHDVGGPHAPFDLSDETNAGAPRGQVQYFRDPASTLANTALGRMDLTTLVDPLALEMDQDYDCVHNSNPDCSYNFYGTACLLEATMLGVDLYTSNYGSIDPGWRPAGCP